MAAIPTNRRLEAFFDTPAVDSILRSEDGRVITFLDPDVTQGRNALSKLDDATIMMVDDEPTTMEVVQMLLEDAGYFQFVTTSDSRNAMQIMEQSSPDLLLLDLMMPQVTGFDILSAVRSDRTLARIPVIVLTSSSDSSTKLKALDLGANDFLAKPVDPSELVLRVRNNLAVKAYQDRVRYERENTDRLLLNILPEPIADRLKAGERTIADYFEHATVLFADLVNFTEFASNTEAKALVTRLNEIFFAFDELVARKGLEKIKTTGDAYMLAGGVPIARDDHAAAVVDAGLEMIDIVRDLSRRREDQGFELRVGVHTGSLVAGVIGSTKFNYDVWGDTVNVASRMETNSVPNRLQISEATLACVGNQFEVEARGPIMVKGKGLMNTFLVNRRA